MVLLVFTKRHHRGSVLRKWATDARGRAMRLTFTMARWVLLAPILMTVVYGGMRAPWPSSPSARQRLRQYR
jgi:hypothetical protein